MRIEIMIDKEKKISHSTLDALESELLKNLPPNTQEWQSASARAVQMVLS